MLHHKPLIILGILSVLIAVAGGLIYYLDNADITQLNKTIKRFFSPPESNYQIVENQLNDKTYRIDKKIFNHAEVRAFLDQTPILDLKQQITITTSPENIVFSYIEPNDEVSSGFWFKNADEEVNLYLYINPDSSEELQFFDLHRTYLLSLLYAAEYWKQVNWSSDEIYQPQYEKAREVVLDIVMDAIENKDYFILYE